MSTASTVINRAQQFVNEGQPYTFGGKNEPMNKSKKSHVQWLKQTYGSGSGHYEHILSTTTTAGPGTPKNYNKYINADSSQYVLIDCSGLTDVAFKAGGINIGAGSSVQNTNAAQKVGRIDPKKNPDAVKPGALLHRNGHVAVMGKDKMIIEAKGWKFGCVAGQSKLSSFTSAYNLCEDGNASAPQAEKQEPAKVIGKATVVNVSAYLNVRPEAGTTKAAIGKLYNGNQVDVTGEAGDWYQINYNGKSAYISKKYAKMNDSQAAQQNTKKDAENKRSDEAQPTAKGTPGDFKSLASEAYDIEMTREGHRDQIFYDIVDRGAQEEHINLGTGSAVKVRNFTKGVGAIDVTIGGVLLHFDSDQALDEAIWKAIGAEYKVVKDLYKKGVKTGWRQKLKDIGSKIITDSNGKTAQLCFTGEMGYLNAYLSQKDVEEVKNVNLSIDTNFGDAVKDVFAKNASSGNNIILKGFIHAAHAAGAMPTAIKYFGKTQNNLSILAEAVKNNQPSSQLTEAMRAAINGCSMGDSAKKYCINNALKYIAGK